MEEIGSLLEPRGEMAVEEQFPWQCLAAKEKRVEHIVLECRPELPLLEVCCSSVTKERINLNNFFTFSFMEKKEKQQKQTLG